MQADRTLATPPRRHIIVADDEPLIRYCVAGIARRCFPSAAISAVNDGHVALQLYEQCGADLLITDNNMPRLGGLDLVRILRSRQATIPILMLSADGKVAESAYAAGVTRFMKKDLGMGNLAQAVADLLPPPL